MAFALPSLFGKGKQPRATKPTAARSATLSPTLAVVPVTKDGSKALAFGLNWTVLFGQGTKKALIKEHKLKNKANAHIEQSEQASADDPPLHGFGVIKGAKRGTAIYSAAVVLAEYAKTVSELDAGFIIELSATRCAFVGIRSGQPDIEADVVGTFAEVCSESRRFADTFSAGVSLFVSERLVSVVEEQKHDAGYIRTRPMLALGALAKSLPDSALITIGAEVSTAVIVSVVAACVAGALLVFGYQYVQKQRLKSRSALEELVRNNPGVKYLATRDAALVGLAKTPVLSVVAPLKKAVWAVGLQRAGFTAFRMDCDTTACMLTWRRAGGTYARFDSSSKPVDNAAYLQSLLTVNTSASIEAQVQTPLPASSTQTSPSATPVAAIKPSVNLDATALPRQSEQLVPLGTLLQKMQYAGMTVSWGTPALIGRYEGTEPIESVPNSLMGADWLISGPVDLIDLLNLLPPNFAIKTISVDLPDERAATVFTANGYFFVRP